MSDPTAGIPPQEPFAASLNGERGRFVKIEHFNEGPGWMCYRVTESRTRHGPTIASLDLTDVVRDEPGANLRDEMMASLKRRRRPA